MRHAYAKIVEARRGGFCYECNGLFAAMLEALGFRVTILSARMALGGRVSPEFGHMVLRVDLDVPYLVDVGNGESCRAPLRFDGANERDAEGKTYRVGSHDATPALMFRTQDDPWRPRFLIDATPRRREEFAAMCRFHQTSPESHFTRQRLVTLATDRGRLTVVDRRFHRDRRGPAAGAGAAVRRRVSTVPPRAVRTRVGVSAVRPPGGPV